MQQGLFMCLISRSIRFFFHLCGEIPSSKWSAKAVNGYLNYVAIHSSFYSVVSLSFYFLATSIIDP